MFETIISSMKSKLEELPDNRKQCDQIQCARCSVECEQRVFYAIAIILIP